MATFTLVIQPHADVSATQLARDLDKTGKRQAMKAVQNFLQKIAGGNLPAYVTTQVSSAFASGTITCDESAAVDGTDEVTIGVTVLAVEAAPANENQFEKGASDAAFATNLAAAINAHSVLSEYVLATADAAVVTVTSRVPGVIGNAIALAETGSGMVVSGSALSGGSSDEFDAHVFGFDATA